MRHGFLVGERIGAMEARKGEAHGLIRTKWVGQCAYEVTEVLAPGAREIDCHARAWLMLPNARYVLSGGGPVAGGRHDDAAELMTFGWAGVPFGSARICAACVKLGCPIPEEYWGRYRDLERFFGAAALLRSGRASPFAKATGDRSMGGAGNGNGGQRR